MKTAYLRFYAGLNDFLPEDARGRPLACPFSGRPTVKDLVEGMGVPHAEVALILHDSRPVDFSYGVEDGARYAVYPRFHGLEIDPEASLLPEVPSPPAFVADAHLGRLAKYLRMLGFDTRYRNDFGDAELARLAAAERRVLLTRDRKLLMRSLVTHGYFVRAEDPQRQFAEVFEHFGLYRHVRPLTRCLRCNTLLVAASPEEIAGRVPPSVLDRYERFYACPTCGGVYWEGTHHARMHAFVERLLARHG